MGMKFALGALLVLLSGAAVEAQIDDGKFTPRPGLDNALGEPVGKYWYPKDVASEGETFPEVWGLEEEFRSGQPQDQDEAAAFPDTDNVISGGGDEGEDDAGQEELSPFPLDLAAIASGGNDLGDYICVRRTDSCYNFDGAEEDSSTLSNDLQQIQRIRSTVSVPFSIVGLFAWSLYGGGFVLGQGGVPLVP